tara:strand:+ start:2522 stop:3727 length:1206 start_codon:yes stop_codon:yes gene_type:complete
MAYAKPSRDNIKDRLITYFQAAGFNNITAGTPEHALMNILADNLDQLYVDMQSSYNDVLPLNASGAKLDLWADFFNLTRGTAVYAEDTTLTNVHFLISDANRATVFGGQAFTVPQGTEVSVDGLRVYETISDTTIPAAGQGPYTAYVGVRAKILGGYTNVDAGELNSHNLASVLPEIEGISLIEVTNKFAITTGTFPQLDSALQIDLQNVFGKSISTNLEGIVNATSRVAGVSDVTVLEAKRGTGTFSLFIDSTAPVVSIGLMQQVQAIIDVEKPVGTIGYVEYPIYKSITIKFEIMPEAGKDGEDVIAKLQGSKTENMIAVINNLQRGAIFSPNELLSIVLGDEDVLTGVIKELKIGKYNILEDKVLNNEFTSGGMKTSEWNEKWFISSDLISYCTVENE